MSRNNAFARIAAAFLCAAVAASAFSGCEAEETPAPEKERVRISAGFDSLPDSLNPFTAVGECADALMSLTQVRPLLVDRVGEVVKNGISGETIQFRGEDYYYSGICDIALFMDESADSANYTVTLKDGLVFSDGHKLDADDLIFSMYVLMDPSYSGTHSLKSTSVSGLKNYLTGASDEEYDLYSARFDIVASAGPGHVYSEEDPWSPDEQAAFDEAVAEEWKNDLRTVISHTVAAFSATYAESLIGKDADTVRGSEDYSISFAMAALGFASLSDDGALETVLGSRYTLEDGDAPSFEDFYNELFSIYGGDPGAYWDDVNGGESDSDDVMSAARNTYISAFIRGSVGSVSGVEKIDDRTVRITTDGYNGKDIYEILDFWIAPLHIYGDESLYDPEKGCFGFRRGDLSGVLSDSKKLTGAGDFALESVESGKISLIRNPALYGSGGDEGLVYGIDLTVRDKNSFPGADIVTFSGSAATAERLRTLNERGELSGRNYTVLPSDTGSYGYIGINAATVNVGGEPGSEASVSLRKALATVFSVYRQESVSAYFGESARVINYSVSETSYVSPDTSDSGYAEAFSKRRDGSDIFTPYMNARSREEAALDAAVEYLSAAGYEYDADIGKIVAAPEGASMEFEAIVPGGGTGDHPCLGILKSAAESLKKIGIIISVTDHNSNSALFGSLRKGTVQIWCAARAVSEEPDMDRTYLSSAVPKNGGRNYYGLSDEILDYNIRSAVSESDRQVRYVYYREALEIIMDWAVEVPVYQRQDFTVISNQKLDTDSIPDSLTVYHPWYVSAGGLAERGEN